jgi:hypothetical protein
MIDRVCHFVRDSTPRRSSSFSARQQAFVLRFTPLAISGTLARGWRLTSCQTRRMVCSAGGR